MDDNSPDSGKQIEQAVNKGVVTVLGAAKTGIFLLCIVFAVIMLVSPLIGAFNAMVDSDLQVQRAAANVKVDLERRADLLPNLAASVKGSAEFEHNTLVETIASRAGASAQIKEHIKTGGTDIQTLDASNSQLSALLGNFVKLQEQYPTLQSTQQFRELEAQITATENEILVDRQTYNAAVMQYKGVTTTFPNTLVSGLFGYTPDKYQMWESPDSARTQYAPNITFDYSEKM